MARIDALFGPSISLFFGLSFVIALVGGAWMIQSGELTLGLLTSFTLYLGQMLGPMLQFGWQFNVFQRGSASWSRLEKLFLRKPSIQDINEAQPAPVNADITLAINEFTYPDDSEPTLKNIHARIPAGSFLGITGRNRQRKKAVFCA